nr:methyltransferase domain-containing protein [uncultured Rhodopila sp.]
MGSSSDSTGAADPMQPSQYTAAMLRVIEQRGPLLPIGRAIEIGTGSGVLLAALSRRGAGALWGVDIDPDALAATARLLRQEAGDKPVQLLLGNVWEPVPPLAFDAVIANLPHYPAELQAQDGRGSRWSGGGRRALDVFLHGLAAHLSAGGAAWITHHALVGLEQTRDILAEHRLTAEIVFSWTVHETAARIADLPPPLRASALLRRIGPYHFTEADVLEIRHAGCPPLSASASI